MTTATPAEKTTHHFQAEVTRLLSLVIHSLYSNRDIFLRELLSNASDALDKLRFRAITEPELLPSGETLRIRIIANEAERTLTIEDNGIGMNADALARELGTIAHSGTRAFFDRLAEAERGNVNLIGQFGVGFYSAYLVADRVEVVSRAAGEKDAWKWTSDGSETFSIEPVTRTSQGTSVILHLKADAHYLDRFRIKELVRHYSDYLDYPIEFTSTKDESSTERLNQGKALWQRKPSEVSAEQYEEFYKHLTHDHEAPLVQRHFQVEGTQLFNGLLFIPKHPPLDLFTAERKYGLRLYVKRVLIMEHCEELLPRWLRFVQGVVDSEDLPLNVSREILQDSVIIRVIRKQVVKQVLDALTDLEKTQPDKYSEFWQSFGKVLKEGLHFDGDYKDKLLPLLRYESSRGEGLVSLSAYKARMPEGQKAIYYLLNESRTLAETSPHIEALKKRGYEVLYMVDPIDSFAVESLQEFEGVPFASATGADLELDTANKEEAEASEQAVADIRERMRVVLQDRVSEVRVSKRLTDSPVCLVVPEGGLQPYLERLLRATQRNVPTSKRILEINPDHPIIQNLEKFAVKEPSSSRLQDWIELLYEQALLAEGSPIENPARFAARVSTLLSEVTTPGQSAGSAAAS